MSGEDAVNLQTIFEAVSTFPLRNPALAPGGQAIWLVLNGTTRSE
jgi:hypothetical protein